MSMQIELEMGLIVGKPEIKVHFMKQWTTKYVPAILEYASTSVKKTIGSILSSIQQGGIFECSIMYNYFLLYTVL